VTDTVLHGNQLASPHEFTIVRNAERLVTAQLTRTNAEIAKEMGKNTMANGNIRTAQTSSNGNAHIQTKTRVATIKMVVQSLIIDCGCLYI